jgi:hypothetical protein
MDEHSKNDPKVAALLQLCMKGNEKRKSDPYISIPESYKTLPPFIAKCVNKQFAIDKILSPYKQIAGLFDFVMPETYGAQTMSRLIAL